MKSKEFVTACLVVFCLVVSGLVGYEIGKELAVKHCMRVVRVLVNVRNGVVDVNTPIDLQVLRNACEAP